MQEQQEVSQGSPHKERSSEPWLANSSVGATRASSVFTGVACGNTGHRVETCGTAAAQLIRQLRSKLADALQTKSRKESKLRLVRKDGSHRACARAAYTGTAERRTALVKREAVLEQRRCFEKSEVAWQKLLEYGAVDKPTKCPHCMRQRSLVSSHVQKRSARQHVYMSCRKCHRYFNVLHWSSFRGSRCTPAEILELMESYCRFKFMSRIGLGLLGSKIISPNPKPSNPKFLET